MGHGVTVNVTEPDEIRAGFTLAADFGTAVLVEQYIEGTLEYRAHATPTECVGAFRRLLPSVVGDGHSTIAELIEAKNEKRKLNPSTRSGPIPLDVTADISLRKQNLTRDSVVPAGTHVVVRNVNGITSGGDSEECLDTVHDSIKQTAVGAVASIPGMSWGGADLLVEEKTGTPYVLEVNTNAAISGSTFPVFGTTRDLAETIWRLMYEQSVPESTQKPRPPEPLIPPEHLLHLLSDSSKPTITLSELLAQHLLHTGHQITHHNSDIWSAQSFEGPTLWFNTVLTQNDLRTAVHPLRRPLLLRRIMREMKIPRPAARRLRCIEDLEGFRGKFNSDVGLVPLRNSYSGPFPVIVERDTDIDISFLRGRKAWLAYVRSSGSRFRVITTPNETLAVTAPAGQAMLDETDLRQLSHLAASAVSAVPHLRWAVVDVLLSHPQSLSVTSGKAVVEGMAINPEFLVTDVILAGSFKRVFDVILPTKK